MTTPSPRALLAPTDDVLALTTALCETALAASRSSDRKRVILPLHTTPEDSLHRMFNAIQPGSYIRPHRHTAPRKAEGFLMLRGALWFYVFNDDGSLKERLLLRAGSEQFGVDLKPGLFHSMIAIEPDTLIYEVKAGPYSPTSDKDFAAWAPAEGSAEVAAYMTSLLSLTLPGSGSGEGHGKAKV